jgi:hypothetical protein
MNSTKFILVCNLCFVDCCFDTRAALALFSLQTQAAGSIRYARSDEFVLLQLGDNQYSSESQVTTTLVLEALTVCNFPNYSKPLSEIDGASFARAYN